MKYLLMGFVAIILLVMCFAKPNKTDNPTSPPTKDPASEYLSTKQQQLEQAQQAVAIQQAQINAQQDALNQIGKERGVDMAASAPMGTAPAQAPANKVQTATQPLQASGKDWAQLCHNSSLLGEQIMRAHQAGGSLTELITLAQTADPDTASILQGLVQHAHQATRYTDATLQQDMISSFKNTVYATCMQNHA